MVNCVNTLGCYPFHSSSHSLFRVVKKLSWSRRYELKSFEADLPFLALFTVQHLHCGSGKVSRVLVLVFELFIDPFEFFVGHDRFSADNKMPLIRDLVRYPLEKYRIVRHNITFDSFAAARDCVLKGTIVVSQNDRQTVHFP